jgi:hypothetical protein
MILVATASTVRPVSVRSEPILGWAPTIMTVRMKTVALGTALSAPEARAEEKQHSGCEQQSKNAHSEQNRAVHMLRPSSFLALSRYH